MATITVNIEVNDEQFKNLCIDNINDLPKDKMEEVLLKAVETALMNDTARNRSYGDSSSILVTKEKIGYHEIYKPTKLLEEVIKKIDTTKYIDPIAKLIGKYIKDNYKRLIAEYMIQEIAKMLFSDEKEYSLQRTILADVNSMLNRR